MSDLAAFISARLDEDEAAAKSAWGDADWTWRGIGRALDERPSVADTVHIARHDPARVLREVDAKRKILAAHSLTAEKVAATPYDPYTGERLEDEYENTCAVCGWAGGVSSGGCLTLRLLAAIYSDHPDYDPAWA